MDGHALLQGDLPTQGSNPGLFSLMSPALAGGFFTMSVTYIYVCIHMNLILANLAISFYGVLYSPLGLWIGFLSLLCALFFQKLIQFLLVVCSVANLLIQARESNGESQGRFIRIVVEEFTEWLEC